jgi:uncharacterized membrane protein
MWERTTGILSLIPTFPKSHWVNWQSTSENSSLRRGRGKISVKPMRITSRRGTIVFFLCLGIGLVALAVALNVGWIILNWREGVLLFFGIIFFALIIAGMIVNTSFLVREIRRSA